MGVRMCKICINTFIEECYCDICEKITLHEVFYCCDKIGRKLEQYDWKSKRCICGNVQENMFWNKATRFKLMAEKRLDIGIKF